jgi:hypothetical protein
MLGSIAGGVSVQELQLKIGSLVQNRSQDIVATRAIP